ncbi:monooxygenase, partial [Mycobacterium kansasii]
MRLPQIGLVSELFKRAPKVLDQVHQGLLWGSGILADIATKPSWRRRAVQAYARLSLRAQVPSPMRDDL